MLEVIVNGTPLRTSAPDVAGLVESLNFAPGSVFVELNGTALRPAEWSHALAPGDRIELMRIAAGG